MAFENDFVLDEYKEFEIEGRKFKFKITTADDELNWVNLYIVRDENGKLIQDLSKRAKCKFANLVEVPWNEKTIKKASKHILGEEKTWKEMNPKDRQKVVGKMVPRLYDKIVTKINEVDGERNDIKKNSQKKYKEA